MEQQNLQGDRIVRYDDCVIKYTPEGTTTGSYVDPTIKTNFDYDGQLAILQKQIKELQEKKSRNEKFKILEFFEIIEAIEKGTRRDEIRIFSDFNGGITQSKDIPWYVGIHKDFRITHETKKKLDYYFKNINYIIKYSWFPIEDTTKFVETIGYVGVTLFDFKSF